MVACLSFEGKSWVGFISRNLGKGKSKMSKHVTHGYHLVKGKSSHPMEDYVVAEFKQVEEHELGLFAIFDDHLSHDIPDHLRSHLFVNILNEITNYVMSIVNKKNKNDNLKAHAVKIHLWVFVNALIDNLAFDSQTKETLTIRQSSFGSKCELSTGVPEESVQVWNSGKSLVMGRF
ncbi:putative protein phosphatase 2C 39 [Camellia lanceoleosa]|uniref:Uncharacterized protein n=1 Tax=Camellia lanceoleosa TaxID=1840588 RepID=A0ACC0I421_9ERIC|nr:putative protein phosphatase 2C 39 [Camellia lanceoleosa]